jgi:hypothetical protein
VTDPQLIQLCQRYLEQRKADGGHRLSFTTRGTLEHLNRVMDEKMSAYEREQWCWSQIPRGNVERQP